jgi:hypothetical protein
MDNAVTECTDEGCEATNCKECGAEVDPDNHLVLWIGQFGEAICRSCAESKS